MPVMYDTRRHGSPGAHRLSKAGLFVPSSGGGFGYGFDWMPTLGGAAPVYAVTAQDPALVKDGSDVVSSLVNYGTAGGLFVPTTGLTGPVVIPAGINGRKSLEFSQARLDGLTADTISTLTPPFTVILVLDYNPVGTSVWFGGAEGGASNAQVWESAANQLNMDNGSTRTIGSWSQAAEVWTFTFGNGVTTDPQIVENELTRLSAGSTGTGDMSGLSLGSNTVPETTSTLNGHIGAALVYDGEVGQTAAGITLVQNFGVFYNTYTPATADELLINGSDKLLINGSDSLLIA